MPERRLCTVYIPGPDGQYGTTVSAASAFEAARAAVAWFLDPFWKGPKTRVGTILTIGAMGTNRDIRVAVRPEYLDERARKEWRRMVPVLRRMKVLTEADGMGLANLCQTYSTLVKAQEKLSELGILYKAPSGYVMQSPLWAVVNQCVDTITKLSREFGLTPAARSRIIAHTDETDSYDELERILNTPRPPHDFPQSGMKPQ